VRTCAGINQFFRLKILQKLLTQLLVKFS